MRAAGRVVGRWLGAWLIAVSAAWVIAADPTRPGDDSTYRPTVMVRQGKALGSGTIIASIEGETLVLTASHVVESSETAVIELNRFNLGLERSRSSVGFPRKLAAKVVARDEDADLAILRIKGELALPFVARLAADPGPPADGTDVTTIGFDNGDRLIGFTTQIRTFERLDMGHGGGDRPFLITEHPPEHGRSGGGLFRGDGAVVGVCVGRMELRKGRKIGLFSDLGNVRALIEADDHLRTTLARSTRRPKSPAR